MIPRYSRPEMSELWSDQSRFQIWLEIELLALEKLSEIGEVPAEALSVIKKQAGFSVERIQEIEAEVHHDVIAFVTNVAETVGPKGRWVHRGLTSSDVLDTAFSVQLSRAGEMILRELDSAIEMVERRALEFKHAPCIGRTHGIHAEPTTFGLKLLGWFTELQRQQERLQAALEGVAFGKLSGAVGTYRSISPEVELHVMKVLGLSPEPVATQVVPRDRHAHLFGVMAGLASSLERFSVEIRHLHRTEVGEVREGFGKKQKGSSAMPHKRNPILSENLSGLARLLRSYAQAAYENIPLWHERDISHSSVERVIAPDATTVLHFMLVRFRGLLEKLEVDTTKMVSNLEMNRGLFASGGLLNILVDRGLERETAYSIVQEHAFQTISGGADLEERVRADARLSEVLSADDLRSVFDLAEALKAVDGVFERVLGAE